MNIAPISEPNTIRPAQAATQNVGRAADVQVVERVRRAALPDEEGDQRRRGDRRTGSIDQRRLVRDRREVDPEDQRADEQDREHAAEVVDRLRRLVHVAGHELERHHAARSPPAAA